MPFNFSSPEYLSHPRTRKSRVSSARLAGASPAHMNSPSIVNFFTKVIGATEVEINICC